MIYYYILLTFLLNNALILITFIMIFQNFLRIFCIREDGIVICHEVMRFNNIDIVIICLNVMMKSIKVSRILKLHGVIGLFRLKVCSIIVGLIKLVCVVIKLIMKGFDGFFICSCLVLRFLMFLLIL